VAVRKGKKLILMNGREESGEEIVELDGFYSLDGDAPALIGQAENGEYYNYISGGFKYEVQL
jgi:hypothetical protein